MQMPALPTVTPSNVEAALISLGFDVQLGDFRSLTIDLEHVELVLLARDSNTGKVLVTGNDVGTATVRIPIAVTAEQRSRG